MNRIILISVLVVTIASCTPDDAPHDDADARVEVGDAWVRPVIGIDTGRVNTAAYFTITNHADGALALIEARSQVAALTEVHETVIEEGVASMRRVDRVEIPVGETLAFQPLGVHLMLLDLNRDLAAGDSLSITLRFDDGTEEVAPFVVRPATL